MQAIKITYITILLVFSLFTFGYNAYIDPSMDNIAIGVLAVAIWIALLRPSLDK